MPFPACHRLLPERQHSSWDLGRRAHFGIDARRARPVLFASPCSQWSSASGNSALSSTLGVWAVASLSELVLRYQTCAAVTERAFAIAAPVYAQGHQRQCVSGEIRIGPQQQSSFPPLRPSVPPFLVHMRSTATASIGNPKRSGGRGYFLNSNVVLRTTPPPHFWVWLPSLWNLTCF